MTTYLGGEVLSQSPCHQNLVVYVRLFWRCQAILHGDVISQLDSGLRWCRPDLSEKQGRRNLCPSSGFGLRRSLSNPWWWSRSADRLSQSLNCGVRWQRLGRHLAFARRPWNGEGRSRRHLHLLLRMTTNYSQPIFRLFKNTVIVLRWHACLSMLWPSLLCRSQRRRKYPTRKSLLLLYFAFWTSARYEFWSAWVRSSLRALTTTKLRSFFLIFLGLAVAIWQKATLNYYAI